MGELGYGRLQRRGGRLKVKGREVSKKKKKKIAVSYKMDYSDGTKVFGGEGVL